MPLEWLDVEHFFWFTHYFEICQIENFVVFWIWASNWSFIRLPCFLLNSHNPRYLTYLVQIVPTKWSKRRFEHFHFVNLKNAKIHLLSMLEEAGTDKSRGSVYSNLETLGCGINIFLKTWHVKLVDLWNQETKKQHIRKLKNQLTSKPRNQETKNPRTKKPRNLFIFN